MATVIEILKYTIPSLIVFLTSYYVIRKFFENEESKRKYDMALANDKIITPLRLQAYERIILFLERISPESLIMRVNKSNMKSKELQTELLNNIRSEFEHNLSQQVYISQQAWEVTKNAKANMIKLINSVADGVDNHSPSLQLNQAILERVIDMKKSPTYDAIEFVKKEIQQVFN